MRIAVLLKDKCHPKNCAQECIKYCPRVRTGDETIIMKEKPVISEELCVGCGICINKCPFEAIKIINLPEHLKKDLVHQYGKNDFRLFRLPCPKKGKVVGILGQNGIGKTTAINILSGALMPNLGLYDKKPTMENLKKFSGMEIYNYLTRVAKGSIKTALKVQYVDKILETGSEKKVEEILSESDETGKMENVVRELRIEHILGQSLKNISGGELQKAAIASTILKDADVFFFDEPSSYLDIEERLRVAKIIRKLSEQKQVVLVEHDLAVLDYLADEVYIIYGSEGAYGAVAQPRANRIAINTYLDGYLKEENIRFRDWKIEFETKPTVREWGGKIFCEFANLEKHYEQFVLKTQKGTIHKGEVVGVVGPNATGKTTFVKMLAGLTKPTKGAVNITISISYKPQYIRELRERIYEDLPKAIPKYVELDYNIPVRELFSKKISPAVFEAQIFQSEIERGLGLKPLYTKNVSSLSGGEKQRVAIGLALAKDADIYLIDEPSAYLDASQRMETAKTIRRVMEKTGNSALVVDHDVYFIDMVSDSIMVFSGESGKEGFAQGPFNMRAGMNLFLKNLDITFRRDAETRRPRINKLDSRLDKEQKGMGEYYYSQ